MLLGYILLSLYDKHLVKKETTYNLFSNGLYVWISEAWRIFEFCIKFINHIMYTAWYQYSGDMQFCFLNA